MHKLCISLPPLAPDYSGVCSALYELGGMSVIHDASGCTGNYTGYDEPRWYEEQSLVFCSGLREIDAILGNDDKFIEKIKAAAQDLKPRFINILGSPVPMVIGSDLTGIAKLIEAETSIPAMGFDTKGLQFYDQGIEKAYREFATRFVTAKDDTIHNSVNVLGATPLDFSANENINDIKRFLTDQGYVVNACWSQGCNFDELLDTSKAEMNLVVSVSGLELARYFKRQYGMPYIVGLPVGKTGEAKLASLLQGENRSKPTPVFSNRKILIIGEQVLSNSLRELMQEEYGQYSVDVATFFMLDKELAQENDIHLKSEFYLKAVVNQNNYAIVVGDPLLEDLLPDNIKFYSLPHVAVSSKIYWHDNSEVIGNKIYEILK